MPDILTVWTREREGTPFDTAAFNRLMNFLIGNLAAPFKLVQTSGSFALIWDPTTDLFTFGASIRFNATLTLDNTIWLDGYKSDHTTPVHLIRVNASDIIELGAANQRLSFNASLTNNTNLSARNAANAASITLIKLNTSDIIELGETNQRITVAGALTNNSSLSGRNNANNANITLVKVTTGDIIELGETAARLTIAAPLTNNTNLSGRNAANSASHTLIKLNTSDIVEVSETGRQTNLLGTVVAPSIDPPTVAGQVTSLSQCKGFYSGYLSGGGTVLSDGHTYNVTSATRNASGNYSIVWDRDFADAFYPAFVTVEHSAMLFARINASKAATGLDVNFTTTAGAAADPDAFHVVAFGVLA